jgi:hypothetical protein
MTLDTELLLLAFRHRIEEPDFDGGLRRISEVLGQPIEASVLAASVGRALADGYIHDPIQLRKGALQCCWHLGLTPRGVSHVRQLREATTPTAG